MGKCIMCDINIYVKATSAKIVLKIKICNIKCYRQLYFSNIDT